MSWTDGHVPLPQAAGAFLCLALGAIAQTTPPPPPTTTGPSVDAPTRLSLQGTNILAPDGRPIQLRGFNVLWWVPPTEQDAADIKALGANCVRYQFGYNPTGQFDPRRLRFLQRHIRLFTSQGLWVIPNVHTFQLADRPDAENVWNAPRLHQEFLDMWDYILRELREEPFIAAWEPINEPHHVDREKLTPWYRAVVAHFRAQDARTPLVIEGANYSGAEELLDALRLDDPNLIYSFHFYHPHEYTHMRRFDGKPPAEYPGKWDRAALAERMSAAVRFRDHHQVPVLCGEWGVQTGAVGYQQWLNDVGGLLEEQRIPWMHWAWARQRRDPVNDTFDCNTEKKEIHGLLAGILRQALTGDRPAPPSAKSRPSPQDH